MQEQGDFLLLYGTKVIKIPKDSFFMNEINPSIAEELKTNKKYVIKSNVREKTFELFIKQCLSKSTLDINFKYIYEYDLLSKEFDYKKDLISLYKNLTTNNSNNALIKINNEITRKINKKNNQKNSQIENFKTIINIILTNTWNCSAEEILKACKEGNIKKILLLTNLLLNDDDFKYSVDTNTKTASISKCLNPVSEVIIPYSITYNSEEYIITSIAEGAFQNSQNIKTILFPTNTKVQIIGKLSFAESSIENILIPSSVTKICQKAFYKCKKLKIVDFESNSKITTIGKDAFRESSIDELRIPSSVRKLKSGCFSLLQLKKILIYNCSEKNICIYDKYVIGKSNIYMDTYDVLYFPSFMVKFNTIPSFIKRIEPYSIFNTSDLFEFPENSELRFICDHSIMGNFEKIKIPSSVIEIDMYGLSLCDKIKQIEFAPNSNLLSIKKDSFFNCNINQITIPKKIVKINIDAFSNCDELKKIEFAKESELKLIKGCRYPDFMESINIPQHVFKMSGKLNFAEVNFHPNSELTIIGKFLFQNSFIKKIVIPSSVITIESHAFENCKCLSNIEFQSNSKLKLIGKNSFSGSCIQKIIIPRLVTCIDESAFKQCEYLEEVIFEANSNLSTIGKYAFGQCILKNISIPSSVTKIDDYAFSLCNKLEKIELNSNSELKSIGNNAFFLSPVSELNIPPKMEELKAESLNGMLSLSISVMPNCSNFMIYKDSDSKFLFGKSDKKNDVFDILYFFQSNKKFAKIPDFCKIIESHVFERNYTIRKIEFSDNSRLEEIHRMSFFGCGIENLIIPSTITIIGHMSFKACRNLNKVVFKNDSKLEIIGISAFQGTAITSIFLPKHVIKIGKNAFDACQKLQIIELNDNFKKFDLVNIESFVNKSYNGIIMIPSI